MAFGPEEIDDRTRKALIMLRQRRGWTRHRLAVEMAVDPMVVYRVEEGTAAVRVSIFQRWCEAVGEPSTKVLRFVITECETPGESR